MAAAGERAYHRRMVRLIGIVVGSFAMAGSLGLAGCGGGSGAGGGGGAISSAPLAGKIGGQAWTFGTGESDAFLSDATTLWVDAYAGTFTPCAGNAPLDGDRLILNLPRKTGTSRLSLDLTETFYLGNGDNLVATSGTIVIDAVTDTTISGGVKFAYDANNSVDGQFTATICP